MKFVLEGLISNVSALGHTRRQAVILTNDG